MMIHSKGWVGTRLSQDRPDVALDPKGQPVVKHLQLKRACQIDIQVVDEQNKPIKGADLSLLQVGDYKAMNQVERTSTDSKGIGRLGGIPASTTAYMVTVQHTDFAPNRVIVTVKDSDQIHKASVQLAKGIEVRGKAICSDGKPAVGWGMYVQPEWWHSHHMPRDAKIDEDGYFNLKHIVPGDYALSYSIPNKGGSMSYPLGPAKLPPNGGLLEVKIPRPSPSSSVEIAGRIKYIGGLPKEGVFVEARSDKNERFFADASPRRGKNQEPQELRFRIGPMPRGVYELRFQSAEFGEKVIRDVKAPAKGLQVEVVYRSKPVIKAQVVDAATGKPVTKFRAQLRKLATLSGPNYVGDPAWHEYESSTGEFQAEMVGPGIYQIQIAAEGFAWIRSRQINTDKDKDLVRIELTPGQTLTGRVLNQAGQPVSGAKIIPLSRTEGQLGGGVGRFVSDDGAVLSSEGQFKLEHLAPGRETLKVMHPDYCFSIVKDIEIKEQVAPEPVAVVLKTGGTIAGRVYDADNRPAPNVTLIVQDSYGYQGNDDVRAGRFANVRTDANGNYEVQHLPEQLCFIMNGLPPEMPVNGGVMQCAVVPKDGEKRIFDLGGSPCIKGRLVVGGKPLGKAFVTISGDNPNFGTFRANAMTNENGAFTFFGVPRGRRVLYYKIDYPKEWVEAAKIEVAERDVDLGNVSPVSNKTSETRPAELEDKIRKLMQEAPSNIGRLNVIAVTKDGKPLPGTTFELSDGKGGHPAAIWPNDLSTQIVGLAGEYVLLAEYPGFAKSSCKVTLSNEPPSCGSLGMSPFVITLQPVN